MIGSEPHNHKSNDRELSFSSKAAHMLHPYPKSLVKSIMNLPAPAASCGVSKGRISTLITLSRLGERGSKVTLQRATRNYQVNIGCETSEDSFAALSHRRLCR